jgi:hypothetical protein
MKYVMDEHLGGKSPGSLLIYSLYPIVPEQGTTLSFWLGVTLLFAVGVIMG